MERLKIFIYDKNCKIIKQYFYSDFVYCFNELFNHNIDFEDDQWNMIIDFYFPPEGLLWDSKIKDWIQDEDKKYVNKKIDLIRFFS